MPKKKINNEEKKSIELDFGTLEIALKIAIDNGNFKVLKTEKEEYKVWNLEEQALCRGLLAVVSTILKTNSKDEKTNTHLFHTFLKLCQLKSIDLFGIRKDVPEKMLKYLSGEADLTPEDLEQDQD